LDISSGNFFCLHVPHEVQVGFGALSERLASRLRRDGIKVVTSQPAQTETGFLFFRRQQTVLGWLKKKAGLSSTEAESLIHSLSRRDLHPSVELAHHAGTPRTLLGVISALAARPDVLIYSTEAIDFEGVHAVHRFVRERIDKLCAIHISMPHVHGDGTPAPRICPSPRRCIELRT
jgi:hypothetical protein